MQLWINSKPNRWLCPPVFFFFFGHHYVSDPWGVSARKLTQSPGLPQCVTITALKTSHLEWVTLKINIFPVPRTLCAST